jgi:hypothetical protein
MMKSPAVAFVAFVLAGCAPPPAYPPFVYASPIYAPAPMPPLIYAPPAPPTEPPFAIPPGGAAPGTPAQNCDMQGRCYSADGSPPPQIYHGDPAHPDRVTPYPPPPITNHPPIVMPPSSDEEPPQ